MIFLSTISSAQADRPIRIVGSTAVYGFITMVAERMGKTTDFRTPIVEATGTGGGVKIFCGGKGKNYPDAVNTSRPMTPEEKRLCQANGVGDLLEIQIGYDGIVIGAHPSQDTFPLTRVDLSKALSEYVDTPAGWVKNPYKTWDEVNSALPNTDIVVLGPTSTLASRELFDKKVIHDGCLRWAHDQTKCTGTIREDGAFIEVAENESVIIQKLELKPEALGFVSYGFFVQNPSKIQPMSIDGIMPTVETISKGTYPLTRPLYIYIKKAQMKRYPGLKALLHELLSNQASGPNGYLLDKGLIPVKPEVLAQERAKIESESGK